MEDRGSVWMLVEQYGDQSGDAMWGLTSGQGFGGDIWEGESQGKICHQLSIHGMQTRGRVAERGQ